MSTPPLSSSSSSSYTIATFPMVPITVIGIFAAFVLLASYYAFVTKCQLLRTLARSRQAPWRYLHGRRASDPLTVIRTVATEDRGLGLPLIHMLPIVKFRAAMAVAAADADTARISVAECAVCLSEFAERERVRLLPNCSHAFHIDCIDTWLQGSTKCPFCRSDITVPVVARRAATLASCSGRQDQELSNSIVVEVRGEHESWTTATGHHTPIRRVRHKAESVGDEAIDTRKKDEEFAVQPMRRSLSMDSSCDKQLYLAIHDILRQRQV